MYLVLFKDTKSYSYYAPGADGRLEYKSGVISVLDQKVFTVEQEAIEYAIKKSGSILVPAEIQSRVVAGADS